MNFTLTGSKGIFSLIYTKMRARIVWIGLKNHYSSCFNVCYEKPAIVADLTSVGDESIGPTNNSNESLS